MSAESPNKVRTNYVYDTGKTDREADLADSYKKIAGKYFPGTGG